MDHLDERATERLCRFIKPCGVLLTERADVLARIYAGVMASGNGYQDDRLRMARKATHDFLEMLDGVPPA